MACKRVALGICALLSVYLAAPVSAQDLDQQAWLSVSNKLATYFPPAADNYKVQFPSAPMNALWADKNSADSILSLNSVAGVIPPWGPIWGNTSDSLSERYGFLVSAIDPPAAKDVDPKVKAAALKKYDIKFAALKKATTLLRKEANQEAKDRADEGLPFTLKDRVEWWSKNSGSLTLPLSEYKDAADAVAKTIDPNSPVYDARDRYFAAQKAAATNSYVPGAFEYDGSELALNTLINNGKAADAAHTCTGGWTFNKTTSVQQSSTSSWSASGSYGVFVSVSGGGSHSEDSLKEDGTYVNITFCALGYIPIGPKGWYSSSLMTLLKDSQLKLQANSVLKTQKLFGEGGWLSRIPVGVIVGYKPVIQAKLSSAYMKTTVNSWNAGGGVGFGPVHIGGSGGSTSREQVKQNADGSYTFPAPGDQPYILAIVSKEVP